MVLLTFNVIIYILRSDILRIQVVMHYGGIYMDTDVFVVNSLDKYRHYEMVVSWDKDGKGEDEGIGNMIFFAHKSARFLRAYYDSFR